MGSMTKKLRKAAGKKQAKVTKKAWEKVPGNLVEHYKKLADSKQEQPER